MTPSADKSQLFLRAASPSLVGSQGAFVNMFPLAHFTTQCALFCHQPFLLVIISPFVPRESIHSINSFYDDDMSYLGPLFI